MAPMPLSFPNLAKLGCSCGAFLIKSRQASNWFSGSLRALVFRTIRKIDSPHAREIGDPILRQRADTVDITTIHSPEFKQIVERMFKVMRKAGFSSISAPQIGVGLRVIALENTANNIKKLQEANVTEQDIKDFGIVQVPPTVLINPKYKIIDSTLVTLRENCISFKGYSALVPRAKEIEVSAFDTEARPVTWRTLGWTARMVQHEVDHLDGKLYVDFMLPESMMNNNWRYFVGK